MMMPLQEARESQEHVRHKKDINHLKNTKVPNPVKEMQSKIFLDLRPDVLHSCSHFIWLVLPGSKQQLILNWS